MSIIETKMLATVSNFVVVRINISCVSTHSGVCVRTHWVKNSCKLSHSFYFEDFNDEMNHEHWRTEIPHTRSQVYSLSNFLFLCQKGSALPCSRLQKVNQLTVFLDEFALKPWQKVLVQIIYLLNILAYKKYQITIPQYTSNARRHFEFHSSETWRHTGSDDSNVFPWDPLELLASVFFQRDLEFRIGKEFYSRISYFLHSSLEYATFLIACLIEITLLPFLEEKSGPKLRRTKRFHQTAKRNNWWPKGKNIVLI